MRRLIDTHCHIYDESFKDDLTDVVNRACQSGVERLLLPNINPQTLPELLRVCDTWPDMCYPMIGLHPEDLSDDFNGQLTWLKSVLDKDQGSDGPHRFIGIGETGLDLYWDKSRLDDQIISFRKQIEWALEYDLPIVIHSRECFNELMDVLLPYRQSPLRGIFHCFSGSEDEAAAMLEFQGFMFGIGGVLTFRKSTLPSVLPMIPLERVVLETDCPYLSPVPFRGKRNEPSYIVSTATVMSQVYGCTVDHIAEVTTLNALRLFRL